MSLCLVYITTKDKKEAQEIGRILVEERFAACVNIIDHAESIYWWEGKIEEGCESILIAKTSQEKVPLLTAKVKELSSYSCPCVVSLSIKGGNEEYLRWVRKETV